MKNVLQEKSSSDQINILYMQPLYSTMDYYNKISLYGYQDLVTIGKTNYELKQLFPEKGNIQPETVFSPHNRRKVNYNFNYESSVIETATLNFFQANVSFSMNPVEKYKQAKLLLNQIEKVNSQNPIVITGNFGPFDSIFYMWFQKKLEQTGIVSIDSCGSNIFYSINKLECINSMRGFDVSSMEYLVNEAKLKLKK